MKKKSHRLSLLSLFISLVLICPQAQALPEKIYHSLDLFTKVLFLVEKDYVEEVDGEKIINGAIQGMLNSLDPYTVFLTSEHFKDLKVDTMGRFGGVGLEVTVKDGVLTVVTPLEDTPAFLAGVHADDRILKIDGVLTKDMSLDDAVHKMRGKQHSKVVLTLYRQGVEKPFDVTLERQTIKIQSVKSELIDSDIAYVRVVAFQEKTTDDLIKAIESLKTQSKSIHGMILDLRNNPGGLLDEAIAMSDLFLKSGVIVSTRGRGEVVETAYAKDHQPYFDYPLVVLINKGSASASEIVAGALKDHKRAKLIGTKSFGKASVQTVVPLGDDSGLKMTIAKYFTPSGKLIDGVGVSPDYFIVMPPPVTEDKQASQAAKQDLQKEAAVSYLHTGKVPKQSKEVEAGKGN